MAQSVHPRDGIKTRNVALLRVLRVMRLMREPRTVADLSAALGVCGRTIRRDFDVLAEAGVPLESRRRERRHGLREYWVELDRPNSRREGQD